MKLNRKVIKMLAKRAIKGNKLKWFLISLIGSLGLYGILFIIGLMLGLVLTLTGAVSNLTGPEALETIVSLITFPIVFILMAGLQMSFTYAAMNIYDKGQCKTADVWFGFSNILKSAAVFGKQCLFTALWSILLVVPGIVKSFSYGLAMYISIDNPEMSAGDCIKKSMELMKGHRWEYFVFILSFYGWALLGYLTFGILYIWLIPYMQTSMAGFYRELVKQSDSIQEYGTQNN